MKDIPNPQSGYEITWISAVQKKVGGWDQRQKQNINKTTLELQQLTLLD